jgi:hypothetical protein
MVVGAKSVVGEALDHVTILDIFSVTGGHSRQLGL